jgi:glyoxylase-like metal-dependent hydrolase (beta-lactamase superfamily II)
MQRIRAICLSLPLKLGTVNCYLVETGTGFVLVDTGSSNRRAQLEGELAMAGCRPGNLHLVILTHGDFDHIGNAAHLRGKFGAKLAMHRDDSGMAEHGNMFWNRSSGNALLRLITPILFRFPRASRFRPDPYLADGDDLSEYGLDAQVLTIPGHSRGSIGILTANGDLFCGDLLVNSRGPETNSIMDDRAACEATLRRLEGLDVNTVYPGHGEPFPMAPFLARRARTRKEE